MATRVEVRLKVVGLTGITRQPKQSSTDASLLQAVVAATDPRRRHTLGTSPPSRRLVQDNKSRRRFIAVWTPHELIFEHNLLSQPHQSQQQNLKVVVGLTAADDTHQPTPIGEAQLPIANVVRSIDTNGTASLDLPVINVTSVLGDPFATRTTTPSPSPNKINHSFHVDDSTPGGAILRVELSVRPTVENISSRIVLVDYSSQTHAIETTVPAIPLDFVRPPRVEHITIHQPRLLRPTQQFKVKIVDHTTMETQLAPRTVVERRPNDDAIERVLSRHDDDDDDDTRTEQQQQQQQQQPTTVKDYQAMVLKQQALPKKKRLFQRFRSRSQPPPGPDVSGTEHSVGTKPTTTNGGIARRRGRSRHKTVTEQSATTTTSMSSSQSSPRPPRTPSRPPKSPKSTTEDVSTPILDMNQRKRSFTLQPRKLDMDALVVPQEVEPLPERVAVKPIEPLPPPPPQTAVEDEAEKLQREIALLSQEILEEGQEATPEDGPISEDGPIFSDAISLDDLVKVEESRTHGGRSTPKSTPKSPPPPRGILTQWKKGLARIFEIPTCTAPLRNVIDDDLSSSESWTYFESSTFPKPTLADDINDMGLLLGDVCRPMNAQRYDFSDALTEDAYSFTMPEKAVGGGRQAMLWASDRRGLVQNHSEMSSSLSDDDELLVSSDREDVRPLTRKRTPMPAIEVDGFPKQEMLRSLGSKTVTTITKSSSSRNPRSKLGPSRRLSGGSRSSSSRRKAVKDDDSPLSVMDTIDSRSEANVNPLEIAKSLVQIVEKAITPKPAGLEHIPSVVLERQELASVGDLTATSHELQVDIAEFQKKIREQLASNEEFDAIDASVAQRVARSSRTPRNSDIKRTMKS